MKAPISLQPMPRVLIIEDDAENRRAIAGLFIREDWKVLEANDGDAGLELALRDRPELILCDLLMPRSNGFQVCRAIREQLQPTKIIVVSGRDYGVDRTSALQAGADEYLLKPITCGTRVGPCANKAVGRSWFNSGSWKEHGPLWWEHQLRGGAR